MLMNQLVLKICLIMKFSQPLSQKAQHKHAIPYPAPVQKRRLTIL